MTAARTTSWGMRARTCAAGSWVHGFMSGAASVTTSPRCDRAAQVLLAPIGEAVTLSFKFRYFCEMKAATLTRAVATSILPWRRSPLFSFGNAASSALRSIRFRYSTRAHKHTTGRGRRIAATRSRASAISPNTYQKVHIPDEKDSRAWTHARAADSSELRRGWDPNPATRCQEWWRARELYSDTPDFKDIEFR